MPRVIGWSRVPEPPARMMPFMEVEDSRGGPASRILPLVGRDRASARDGLLRIVRGDFAVRRGQPLPYGASLRRDGVNFSVFSPQATEMMLVLYLPGEAEPVLE